LRAFLITACVLLAAFGTLILRTYFLHRDLRRQIAASVRIAPGAIDSPILRLRELTPFAWDRVCIFPPYTEPTTIQAVLGFRWDGANRTGIDRFDGNCLLVFVRGDAVVASLLHPRSEGDFANVGIRCVANEDAVFIAHVDERLAERWVVLD